MGVKLLAATGALVVAFNIQILNSDQKSYINKYKGLAVHEMERTGVPASITLAQGLLESNSGKSDLATKARNHFGIKCGKNWKGKTMYKKDDDYRGGRLVKSCFRKYNRVEDSYRDHSDFLRNGQRYQFLFDLETTNYKGWAKGLKKAGYATSRTYHKKLIDLIEKYKLYKYDKLSSGQVVYYEEEGYPDHFENTSDNTSGNWLTRNDVKYVLAKEGQTLAHISTEVRYSTNRLMRYNEDITDPNEPLPDGEIVFLQPKRLAWRGRQKYHIVKPNERMYDIAQKYAISLDRLYKRNRMVSDQQPAEGARIKIRGWKVRERPKLGTNFEPVIHMPESEPEKPDTAAMPLIIPVPKKDSEQPEVESGELPPIQGGGTQKNGTNRDDDATAGESVNERTHIVSSGETLWSISRKYGVSVDDLRAVNNLPDNGLRSGMRLKLP